MNSHSNLYRSQPAVISIFLSGLSGLMLILVLGVALFGSMFFYHLLFMASIEEMILPFSLLPR